MPQFIDREHPALHEETVGVIDIGSNSVRLVVYHARERVPLPLYNEKYFCSLGRDLGTTGKLYPEGKRQVHEAMGRFLVMAQRLGVTELSILATAAVRDATDGAAFVAELAQDYRERIEVISGEREAELAAYGVLGSFYNVDGLVVDLGGGSMELAEVAAHGCGQKVSLPLGVLRMEAQCGQNIKKLSRLVQQHLESVAWLHTQNTPVVYAVGGSFRALAKAHMRHTHYPLPHVHGYTLSARQWRDWVAWVSKRSLEQLADMPGIPRKRVETILPAAQALTAVMAQTKAKKVVFSVAGIREGVLYESLSEEARIEDPLLASAAELAAMFGRTGQYARELFQWMKPMFTVAPDGTARLRQVLCMLSEIAWTIDPNFRGDWAYHRVMQSSMKGLKHTEQVMLALAMYYRYESKIQHERPEHALLDERQRLWARLAGRTAHLAFLLSGGMQDTLTHSQMEVEADQLILKGDAEMTASAVVKKRLEGVGEIFNAFFKHSM